MRPFGGLMGWASAALLGLLLGAGPALAQGPLAAGQPMPDLSLARPAQPAQAALLGLKEGGGGFKLSQIKKPWLLIEVFNMYCTICQGEAQRVNQLQALLAKEGLGDKLVMLGIGAGNSPFEVEVFRKKYQVVFPLLPDADYAAHKALGEPGTPYFMLVRWQKGAGRVVLAQAGAFGQPADFLARIKKALEVP